jgi:hypothetical protein
MLDKEKKNRNQPAFINPHLKRFQNGAEEKTRLLRFTCAYASSLMPPRLCISVMMTPGLEGYTRMNTRQLNTR